MAFYNERRPHWSLDIDNGQVPLQAFRDKRVPEGVKRGEPKWMEIDIDG